MRPSAHALSASIAVALIGTTMWMAPSIAAQNAKFHNAPASAAQMKNPYQGQPDAVAAGKKVFGQNCSQCHGNNLQGMGPAPALDTPSTKAAKPGELFWFITTGNVANGMPAWPSLSKQERWQVVTFLESKLKSEAP